MKPNLEILLQVLVVCLIVCAGIFIFNQVIEWKYNAQLLMGPCQLCVKLNPEVEGCWQMEQTLQSIPLNITIPNG